MTKARDIASAAPAPSTVSATELGYLDGVTSAVQTQIDGKASTTADIPKSLIDAKGDLIVGSAADTAARLAVGTNNYILTADSAATNGVKWAAPAAGGKLLQVVSVNVTDGTGISSSTPTDATGFTATITPTSSTSKILILISCQLRITRNSDYFTTGAVRLLRGSTSLAEYDGGIATTDGSPSNGMSVMLSGIYAFNYYDNPASTSALTYKLQGWVPFGTLSINGNGPGSITLLEIGA